MVKNLHSFERSELERDSPDNPLLTDQYTQAVSFVTYQLTGYFLLSLSYLIADTLYNIPHPSSSYILVESKASELLVVTPLHHTTQVREVLNISAVRIGFNVRHLLSHIHSLLFEH